MDRRGGRRVATAPRRKYQPDLGARIPIGCRVSPECRDALVELAAEKGVNLTAFVSDCVAECAGVPA